MKLNKMFPESSEVEIYDLSSDSREKTNNGLYFALKGFNVDGHKFIDGAIENGAVAIVHSDDIDHKQEGISYIQVEDVTTELHRAANIYYGHPSQKMRVHGITGTNGKSTTSKLLYSILNDLGVKAGYIGTVSVEYNGKVFPATLSTPDILSLHRIIEKMRQDGVTDLCMEVSSQGLDLRRVESIEFTDASFTNLSHEHLDYHHNLEEYFQAKNIFFKQVSGKGIIISNIDDVYGQRVYDEACSPKVSYAIEKEADYKATNLQLEKNKTFFTLLHNNLEYAVESPFLAKFNVSNVLNVIAILHENGHPLEKILHALKISPGVEGRLELIDEGQDFQVIVDYAHTPDSFELLFNYLNSVKEEGARLIAVFGNQGSRDAEKRPIMGEIATRLCDIVVLTEVDNRFEEVDDILKDIIKGAVRDNWQIVHDRRAAIYQGIQLARPNDIVVILGKGQEDVIQRGAIKDPYIGDHVCARNVLRGEIYK